MSRESKDVAFIRYVVETCKEVAEHISANRSELNDEVLYYEIHPKTISPDKVCMNTFWVQML